VSISQKTLDEFMKEKMEEINKNISFYKETEFKETPIGKIPKEWQIVRVKDLFKVVTGTTPSTKVKEYWESGTINWITPQDLSKLNGRIRISESERKITEKALKNTHLTLMPKGSIILSTRAPVGYVAVLEKPATFNQGCKGLIPRKLGSVVAEFYAYYFILIKPILESKSYGSTFKELSKKALEDLVIPLPPLEEQRSIAEILSTLDNAIEATEKYIERLERLKRGLMQELLTKGIGHKEFKETLIGKIPKDWSIFKLENLAKAMYYGITAKAVEQNTSLRMLRTTDIKDYKVDWDSLPYCEITSKSKVNNIEKYLLREGDLIVSRAGTVGISILVERDFDDVIFGSYLIKVRLKENLAYPKFIHYYFQSDQYWRHISKAQGSTLKNINLNILKSLLVPLPPLEEQKRIATILSTIDKWIELEKKRKEKLERLKRGLMELLLTGKIRVKVKGDQL